MARFPDAATSVKAPRSTAIRRLELRLMIGVISGQLLARVPSTHSRRGGSVSMSRVPVFWTVAERGRLSNCGAHGVPGARTRELDATVDVVLDPRDARDGNEPTGIVDRVDREALLADPDLAAPRAEGD